MRKLTYLLVLGLFLAACSAAQNTESQSEESKSQTQVALIVQQTLTSNLLNTQTAQTQDAQQTQNAPLPTSTSLPTNTPLPPITVAPLFTSSPLSTPLSANTITPTNTLAPTIKPTATFTSTPARCNWVSFVKDMTVSEGALFPSDSQFTKVWRIKNIGSCDWTESYSLIYFDGKKMGGAAITLPKKVAPGESIDLALTLKVPTEKGAFNGWWIMADANGKTFGYGTKADTPLLVSIRVTDEVPPYQYDLSTNFSSATWKTDTTTLYPNGSPKGYPNYVQYTNLFRMETDILEDEPAILVNVAAGERVRGLYPSYLVQTGDHFVAEIGCVFGIKDCKMKMVLAYRVEGTDVRVDLGEWLEVYDGKNTLIDIDLSGLVGQQVKFVLDMEAKSKSDTNQVFWFLPSIRNP